MPSKRGSSGRAVISILAAVTLVTPGLMAGPSQAQVQTITCPTGFGVGIPLIPPPPLVLLTSLKAVPNPIFPKDPVTFLPALRPDLVAYVANPTAAIQLGKDLFWDMQAGSDNKTACATCHFQAGADVRIKNQLNPGANGAFDGYSWNYTLTAADFPFVDPAIGRNLD